MEPLTCGMGCLGVKSAESEVAGSGPAEERGEGWTGEGWTGEGREARRLSEWAGALARSGEGEG